MITLEKVAQPTYEDDLVPVMLSDETMQRRKEAVLAKMAEQKLDALVVYADLEHGSNWEYLTGFLPRFEEALLVLFADGQAKLVLGNENLNKGLKSRIKADVIHMPHFSLPNQPMEVNKSIDEILAQTGIASCARIGIAGWKLFTSLYDNNDELFDVPSFILDAIRRLCSSATLKNACGIFIGESGVRTINNANEFAHYEYGAALAGQGMLAAMDALKLGASELELGALLNRAGQKNSVVTIAATGERFEKGNLYPLDRSVALGDKISLTVGYKGGLQSRSGYAVERADQLPQGTQDYLEKLAIPYQETVRTWLEQVHVGMQGGELYKLIDKVLPRENFHWTLNPGHLCADEEWLCSPIYPKSTAQIKSGMLFQIDIIPSIEGYNGVSCESGVFIADATLRKEIEREYPELWQRIQSRRAYLTGELGYQLSEDVLPTSSLTAYYRPFMLAYDYALKNI